MNKVFTLILISIVTLSNVMFSSFVLAASDSTSGTKKVAMLISGYGSVDPALSYDLEELVQSYLIFHRNEVQVDIVSPKGGAVLVKNNKDNNPVIAHFKQNTNGLNKLANTLSAVQASKNKYDALFIVGGDGAVFDLPFDQDTQQWITSFALVNAPIAAVCHGPAALIDIKLKDGSYFVANKLVNSFTAIEDHAFKKENIDKYPVIVQTELEKRGAKFVSNSPMLPFVQRDGNLITAQNPTSVAKAAEALVVELGLKPVERKAFKDEASMDLIARARSMGGSQIDIAMSQAPESYDMMYMALYGLYAYKLANSESEKNLELRLMEKIGEYFRHPQYAIHMINTYLERGNKLKARHHFIKAQQQFTDFSLPEALVEKLKS
ncbi:MAG: type 1 glutamine amidotransferase domain-containing protein [Gammaproteobacteria bacterium]|nr:type 1 glutamine amidotransferase domain-containing protein [Gammaproteobacteria bacterium]